MISPSNFPSSLVFYRSRISAYPAISFPYYLGAYRRVVTSIRVCLCPFRGLSRGICSVKFLFKSLALPVVLRLIKVKDLQVFNARIGCGGTRLSVGQTRSRSRLIIIAKINVHHPATTDKDPSSICQLDNWTTGQLSTGPSSFVSSSKSRPFKSPLPSLAAKTLTVKAAPSVAGKQRLSVLQIKMPRE